MTIQRPLVTEVSAGEYQALGYTFEIRLEGRTTTGLEEEIRWTFQDLRLPAGTPLDTSTGRCYRLTGLDVDGRPVLRLWRDATELGTPVTPRHALGILMADVNGQAIASRPDQLTVHAGAVSLHERGILLLGSSGAGKSTLTAALVLSGCAYLSDEAVAIDLASHAIEPFAKPLSLLPDSLEALGCAESEYGRTGLIPASWLRPGTWSGPVPTRMLVFPRFEPGATTSLSRMTRGEALVELANNSFNFVDHGGPWLPRLRDMVAGCTCWRLTSGDAREAARTVIDAAG